MKTTIAILSLIVVAAAPVVADAQPRREITPESEEALNLGLYWLYKNQGPQGNWGSNDLGLVSMGALAFMAAGHTPGRGRYGQSCQKALDYVVKNAKKPRGLLNISHPQRDMYNHGLSAFVIGQAYGMSNDAEMGQTLERALKLISDTQCGDGGWDYRAARQSRGHDLSLAVMQAKALRSAVDSGLDVPPEVVRLAIKSVREHYHPQGIPHNSPEEEQMKRPGQFTYTKGGGRGTIAMAAAGVVCLQEFGQYGDWRIEKNMDVITAATSQKCDPYVTGKKNLSRNASMPFDAYTLYYVGQALYQVGDENRWNKKYWSNNYWKLRDYLVKTQSRSPGNPSKHGYWNAGGHVGGGPGQLYGTSVACFILAIPNRYLPILQEGKIKQFEKQGQDK